MNRLNNKVAVFIGGGSSVGSVACKTFLEEGANVVLVDIDEKYFERTAELRNQYGEDRVVTFIGACTEQADMDEAIRFAVNHFGGVDILLNLAGFHGAGWVDAILPEQWDRAMDVTCTGAYRAALAAMPYMKEQHGGSPVCSFCRVLSSSLHWADGETGWWRSPMPAQRPHVPP